MSNDMIGPPILNPEKATLKESQALAMVSTADRPMMTQAQYMASLFLPGAVAHLQFFTDLAIILLGWLTVTAEVFLRGEFGERYLSNIRLTLGLFMLGGIGLAGGLWGVAAISEVPESAMARWPQWIRGLDWMFLLVVAGYLLAWAAHRVMIRERNRKGIMWHSMSSGTSWVTEFPSFASYFDEIPDLDWTLYRFIEPFVLLAASIVLAILTYGSIWASITQDMPYLPVNAWTTCLWLFFCAAAVFIRNNMAYTQLRDRVLNLVDSRIEAEMLQPSLQGTPKRKTAGFSVVHFPPAQQKVVEESIPLVRPDLAATVREVIGNGAVNGMENGAGEKIKEAA